jgi:hypothetical protein
MTLQKRLWDLVVLAIVIFAAVFATAPWFAFRALEAAAQYEDVQAIGELVDFPAVRGSLTAELKEDPGRRPGRAAVDLARSPGRFQASHRADRPAGAQGRPLPDRPRPGGPDPGLCARRGARPPQPATALDKAKAALAGPHPTIVYWDPNRVRISVKRPGQPSKATVFTFRRDKLFTWRLVHIRLPTDER